MSDATLRELERRALADPSDLAARLRADVARLREAGDWTFYTLVVARPRRAIHTLWVTPGSLHGFAARASQADRSCGGAVVREHLVWLPSGLVRPPRLCGRCDRATERRLSELGRQILAGELWGVPHPPTITEEQRALFCSLASEELARSGVWAWVGTRG